MYHIEQKEVTEFPISSYVLQNYEMIVDDLQLS